MTNFDNFWQVICLSCPHGLWILSKVSCGYATVHDVEEKTLEDRQESFFLSETCKYLYLLFDTQNPINKKADQYIFTTEGHIFPIDEMMRKKFDGFNSGDKSGFGENSTSSCRNLKRNQGGLPLHNDYLAQIFQQIGAELS